jgi:hypothetical protein
MKHRLLCTTMSDPSPLQSLAQSAFDQAFDTLVGKRTVRTVHAPSIDQLFDRRRIK